jgi:hypothetical protein
VKRNILLIYTVAFALCIFGYLLITLITPPDASALTKYDLTPSQAKVIGLTVAAPLIIIWMLALFGLTRISRYAVHIQQDKDGKAFITLSKGLAILVFSLPLVALLSAGLSYMARTRPDFLPTSVIINNYITLITFFAGFYIIRKGAQALSNRLRTRPDSRHYKFWLFCLIVFGLLFAYLTLNNPARAVAPEGVSRAAYYLPDWLIASTIIIPYIIVWYLGMQSAYFLRQYSQRVPGILYKKALGYISNGIVAVILASMLIRFVVSMTEYFNKTGLQTLLGIVYLLIIAISIGYILIAIGARKLQKIEEV